MTNQKNEHINEIEVAQAALRDSIEATKQLSERTESLLQQNKLRSGQEERGQEERGRSE